MFLFFFKTCKLLQTLGIWFETPWGLHPTGWETVVYFSESTWCRRLSPSEICSVISPGIPINPLKPSGSYMYHLLYQSLNVYFVFISLI
jgi:hypothetical protein